MSRELQPVELVRERDHAFEGPRGSRRRCQVCGAVYENGLSKAWLRGEPGAVAPMIHHAYPVSFTEGGSGHDKHGYQRANEAWQRIFTDLLEQADLPRPLARVTVEGKWTFPRRFGRGPDQEAFRYPVSKFFGDALQAGGWLENDWWEMYEFGGATYELEPGARRLQLIVFPTAVAQEVLAA